jgi:hypothetical protein
VGEKLKVIQEATVQQAVNIFRDPVQETGEKKDKLLVSSKDRRAFQPYILINYLLCTISC